MYVPSTEDIRTLYSHNIELYTRIDLLNDRMKTIDSLQGITTEGRISVDADAENADNDKVQRIIQVEKPLHYLFLTSEIIFSQTWSMVIPVVSTSVASSAFLSGASAR